MEISDYFKSYLLSRFEQENALKLARELKHREFEAHSNSLEAYLKEGEGFIPCFLPEPYENYKVIASSEPPLEMWEGDVWFDLNELSFSIRHQPEHKKWIMWVPIFPVYNWQYNTFLKLIRYKPKKPLFYDVPDDCLVQRESQKDETEIASDVYFSEADLYSHWFNKSLFSHIGCQLSAFLKSWPQERFTYNDKLFWSTFDWDEHVATWFRYKNFNNDVGEFEHKKVHNEESLLFVQNETYWYKSQDIQFLTSYKTQQKWVQYNREAMKPLKYSDKVVLLNTANRLG